MKKYLSALSLVLTAMAAIPAFASQNLFYDFPPKAQAVSAKILSYSYPLPETVSFIDLSDGSTVTQSTKSVIHSIVGAACDKAFTPDEVKALCIAVHTQLCIENENGTLSLNTKDKNVFLADSELKNKFSGNYNALCSYCDNVYSTLMLSDGDLIPMCTLPFCTEKKRSSPPIANPYDMLFSNDFTGEANGITPVMAKMMSLQGLKYNEILNYCYNV